VSTPEVNSGSLLQCSFGAAPASFQVLPINRVTAGGTPAGNIMDNVPIVNIPPFGMCQSLANPAVASATAAAMGALTPMPCMPVIPAPWVPGAPTVTIGPVLALDTSCQLMCAWAGVITVSQTAQMTVTVP
jgi:hypothetical protein